MSQYSEMIGSFIRTGNYPMEADYIFSNEAALKDFYSDPINQTLLHKGWLKVVTDDGTGKQALYWVVKKQTNDELEFKRLISYDTTESLEEGLKELQEKLDQEIYDRKVADDAIYGSSDHTVVPEDLNSLLKLANAILELREEIEGYLEKVDTVKEELKATVGTELEDIREYLKTLDYSSLTAVSQALHTFLSTRNPEDVNINTFPELQDFLQGIKDSDTLLGLLENLTDSIINEIMGDPLPTEPFRTLRGIEDFVREFKSQSENSDQNFQTELDQTQVGVGLSADGSYSADQETNYLKSATSVMNALKILDGLITEAINNCNILVEDTNTVDLNLVKEPTQTILSANIKISTESGNGIQAKTDGLFYKLTTEYDQGTLTIKVNDNIIGQHLIGLSTIVESAKYDPDTESIVIVFKLMDESTQTVTIPVGSLIREWDVDNTGPTDVVNLTRTEVLGTGVDKLSADVRLFVDKYQILEKRNNTLYVKGTTDNIVHNDQPLNIVIDSIQGHTSSIEESLQQEIERAQAAEATLDAKIVAETNRATAAEATLQEAITALDTEVKANDQDITNLQQSLQQEIERATAAEEANSNAIQQEVERATLIEQQLSESLNSHTQDTDNPHNVTKEQLQLGNVDNTSDLDKPISNQTQAALNEIKSHTEIVYNITDLFPGEGQGENLNQWTLQSALIKLDSLAIPEQKIPGVKCKFLDENNKWRVYTYYGGLFTEITSWRYDLTSSDFEELATVNLPTATQVSNGTMSKEDKVKLDTLSEGIGEGESILDTINTVVEQAKTELSENISTVDTKLTEHIENKENPHEVTKTQIGLENVTNDAQVKRTEMGEAKGVATLDENGKVPVGQLPGQVDEVFGIDHFVDTKEEIPPHLIIGDTYYVRGEKLIYTAISDSSLDEGKTPEKGVVYSNRETNFIYRWDGEDLVEIGNPIHLGEIAGSAYPGDKGKETTDKLNTHLEDFDNPHQVTKEQVGLSNVDNTADIAKPISMATQAALDKITSNVEAHVNNKSNPHEVTKEQVGLGNVDNTSDVNKPVSTAQQEAINLAKQEVTEQVNQCQASIDAHKADINNPHQVTKDQVGLGKVENYTPLEMPISQSTQNALNGKANLTYVNEQLNTKAPIESPVFKGNPQVENSPELGDNSNRIPSTNWVIKTIEQNIEGDLSSHISDYNNPHRVTAEQVGLGNVNNTSDMDKPVSTATQEALNNLKTELEEKITNNDSGLSDHISDFNNPHKVTAEQVGAYSKEEVNNLLDEKADLVDGKIPSDQLPGNTQKAIYFAGKWDASTNSPALQPDDQVNIGAQYLVTTAGTFNGISFKPNDFIQNINGSWVKIDNNNAVTSVNSKVGDVIIGIEDIDNLQNILDSKANSSDVYSKTEVDNIVETINEGSTQEIEQITTEIEEITNNITNLENNKADLVEGVIPENQLPKSVKGCLKYKGEWDALNNNPPLANTDTEKEGWYYIVSDSGRQFSIDFKVGDWVVNSGGKWTKVNNADAVSSVNGKTGEVTINIEDIPGLSEAINSGGTGLEGHITDYNNPHRVTKAQIGLDKVENYSPAEMPISNAVQTEITRIDGKLQETGTDLSAHIKDYNNPHKVTKAQVGLDKVDNTSDLEKPISSAVQEALYQIKLDATGYATKEQLDSHINDRMNPHQVSASQVGLGNVDNTSDLDKPISNATQRALDQKADINHTHTMTDISDFENSPIIKGFVDSLVELPEDATGGDKYIVKTQVGGGTTRYTLAEYDGATGTWKQKLLSTGTITSIIGGDIYKLTSEGPERVLDAADYKYFYDKIWGETQDLIQSIEWDESTDTVIRLKITTKKSYAAPNTGEATQPKVTPKVSYIDIEKERFISSAYSRPATAKDVENGYASKEGIPVLVIELTTGDEVVIDLSQVMNIYEPVDTSSINMEVSDWTGEANTSYKISATLRIAENSDAVKLVDSNNNGVYARLDKKNTNSIQLVDDGSLSANLVIDSATNNASDILLTVGTSGLSAKFVWGDYE